MVKQLDITGQKFGRWIVLKFAYRKHGNIYWECKCECGMQKNIQGYSLLSGDSKSCGCLRAENPNGVTHNMGHTRLYNIWSKMKGRCLNKKNNQYYLYGGRGLLVYDRWNKFENFRDDMYKSYLKHVKQFGEKETTIDRFPDNNGNYCPENCRWATKKEQSNNRRTNRPISYNGKILNISQFAKQYNIKYSTLLLRINSGWDIEKALKLSPSRPRLKDLAKKYNINYQTFHNRINSLGWNIEKALLTPIRKQIKSS